MYLWCLVFNQKILDMTKTQKIITYDQEKKVVNRQWLLMSLVVRLLSHVQLFATLWTLAHQASWSFRIWSLSNSCQWYYLTISSSATHFSFCLQSLPASGSFPVSQFFASGGQSIGASSLSSVLPKIIQDWSLLGLTGLILQSKGLSSTRPHTTVFSTTIRKHQFFSAQPSLWSNSHLCTWLLEKP